MNDNINIYKPDLMEVIETTQHTIDVKSVRIRFRDEEKQKNFSFNVGQFGLYSVFGYGESTFNICSSSNWKDYLEFCFRKTGRVTEAMWKIVPGETIGFRGPYGNAYPMKEWEGKDLVFVGGGIAMPPIRCAIWYALENREKYGKITIVYGARTVGDLVFRTDLAKWTEFPNVDVLQTVDPGGETPEWNGKIGFVPTILKEAKFDAKNAAALVVGPPVMIKFSLPVLAEAGMDDANIFTSLENRMKCGVGKCGRCNCGPVYVCKEGPVFSLRQMKQLPEDY
ncbi:MAG: FAD/NAD(P)-binding protein [Planctomycetaceae bacterium]|jgi:NAD(P)H-flavin reductase|nr:FAD/NAD(P)-binding protein [Planctomycetaceae bacterium]MDR1268966.1 FAD/NAD(P)-binding protein [Planctomycetaceae bacterium]